MILPEKLLILWERAPTTQYMNLAGMQAFRQMTVEKGAHKGSPQRNPRFKSTRQTLSTCWRVRHGPRLHCRLIISAWAAFLSAQGRFLRIIWKFRVAVSPSLPEDGIFLSWDMLLLLQPCGDRGIGHFLPAAP